MKLATFATPTGGAAIGVVDTDHGTLLDLQRAHVALRGSIAPCFVDMLTLIEGGNAALDQAHQIEQDSDDTHRFPLSALKLLAPVPVPSQIRDCNNFEQHMRDARVGMARLKARLAGKPDPQRSEIDVTIAPVNFRHIVFYISNRYSVVGPDHDVQWPSYTEWMDYEGEFGIFIGKSGKDIAVADAAEHIFGYTIFNDFSARDQQAEEMEGRMGPTKGKSFDTGNAMGPWIVTRDEIPDARNLRAVVRVNGETWGANSTEGMIHSFEDIIAYLSKHETLHPGEFIGSGTIGGCCGLEADRWLKNGDVIEIEIEKLGTLRNRIVRNSKATSRRNSP